jgi:kynurenine formamidase/mono/diheme cytochrome c family protein
MERKTFLAVALLALALSLVAGIAFAQITGDPAKGKVAWASRSCKNCHGVMGEGKYASPRAGDGMPADYWIKQVRTPRAQMPAFSADQIADQDIADMQAYMQTLSKPASFNPVQYEAKPEDLPGKALFHQKRCVACHGDPPYFPVQTRFIDQGRAVTAEAVLKQLRTPARFMPMYGSNQVSDAEAGQMADFMKAIAQSLGETPPAAAQKFELWDTLTALQGYQWVDLTHAFAPGVPRWSGFPDAQFKKIYDYDKDGFWAQEFTHVGQYGTHMDPPAHFVKGLRTVDQIDVKEMAAPLVVINVADKVAANPDYELTLDDIKAWEAKHGPVPRGAFVAMRSDWSKRWPDANAFANKDATGQDHYPGWTVDALKYLYEGRRVVGTGHEPADTDAAVAQLKTGFAAEAYVLSTNHYQIELLANLDKVPEAGAIVFVTVPKPQDGSGFPARVFAIVPKS